MAFALRSESLPPSKNTRTYKKPRSGDWSYILKNGADISVYHVTKGFPDLQNNELLKPCSCSDTLHSFALSDFKKSLMDLIIRVTLKSINFKSNQ